MNGTDTSLGRPSEKPEKRHHLQRKTVMYSIMGRIFQSLSAILDFSSASILQCPRSLCSGTRASPSRVRRSRAIARSLRPVQPLIRSSATPAILKAFVATIEGGHLPS
jgi:hypothetical protein